MSSLNSFGQFTLSTTIKKFDPIEDICEYKKHEKIKHMAIASIDNWTKSIATLSYSIQLTVFQKI